MKLRKEELQGSSADDSFKEKRNEAVAGGVDAVRRRCVCAYVWGQWEKQLPQIDRWCRGADGSGP